METEIKTRQAGVNFHFWLQQALKDYDMESFPKELLQNSDDAGATSVTFVIDYAKRILWHLQDAVLTVDNFSALGNFYQHTKLDDPTKIGKFGVGFCTVFHVCDKPLVFSAGHRWSMELESLKIEESTQVIPPGAEGAAYREECPYSDQDTRAVFQFPFRRTPTTVGDITFQTRSLDEVEKSLEAMFGSPALLFFLNNVRRIRLLRVDQDGTIKVLRQNHVEGEELMRCKAAVKQALLSGNIKIKPTEISSLTLYQRGEATTGGTEPTPEPWWYCYSVSWKKTQVPVGALHGPAAATVPPDADPNSIVEVEVPVVLQLASPLDRAADGPIISVGLPLTGIANPLLCHCSASLELDARRVLIRVTPLNTLILQELAELYCDVYLPHVNPYTSQWPLVEAHQSMQPLIQAVLKRLANNWAKPMFPVLLGDSKCVKAIFYYLRYAPTGVDARILSLLQSLLLLRPTFSSELISTMPDALKRAFEAVGFPVKSFDCAFCAKCLSTVPNADWVSCNVTDEDRFMMLRYILESTALADRVNRLRGVALCQTIKGWRSFDGAKVYPECEWTASLLVAPDTDLVASTEMTKQFLVYQTPAVIDQLKFEDLTANAAAIIKIQLKYVQGGEDHENWIRCLWRFLQESVAVVKESDIAALKPLQLLLVDEMPVKRPEQARRSMASTPQGHAALPSAKGPKPKQKPGGKRPAAKQPVSEVFVPETRNDSTETAYELHPQDLTPRSRVLLCSDAPKCLIAPPSKGPFGPYQEILSVAWDLQVPIVHECLTEVLLRNEWLQQFSVSNVGHVCRILQSKSEFTPVHCRLIRQYLSKEARSITEPATRQLVLSLPIYAVLGKKDHHRPIIKNGVQHPFIVPQSVYDALPSTVRVAEMLAMPEGLAGALGVALMDAERIARSQLEARHWCLMDDVSRLQVFQWVKEKYPHLIEFLLLPSAASALKSEGDYEWKPVTELLRFVGTTAGEVKLQTLLKVFHPSVLPLDSLPEDHPMGFIIADLEAKKKLKMSVDEVLLTELHSRIRRATPKTISFSYAWGAPPGEYYTAFPTEFRAACDFYDMMADNSRFSVSPYRVLVDKLEEIEWVPCILRVPVDPNVDYQSIAAAPERFELSLKRRAEAESCYLIPLTEGVAHEIDLPQTMPLCSEQVRDLRSMLEGICRRWRTLASVHTNLAMQCQACRERRGFGSESLHSTREAAHVCRVCRGVPGKGIGSIFCLTMCAKLRDAVEDFEPNIQTRDQKVLIFTKGPTYPDDFRSIITRHLPPSEKLFPTAERFVHPRCFITKPDYNPFVPCMKKPFWISIYKIPDMPRAEVSDFVRNMQAWAGQSVHEEHLRNLTAYLKFIDPFLLRELPAQMYLPNARKVMKPTTELYYPYDPASVREALHFLPDLLLHPELCPDRFEFSALPLLGVLNLRQKVQQPMEFQAATESSTRALGLALQQRMNFSSFERLVQIAANGGTPDDSESSGRSLRGVKSSLRNAKVLLCTDFTVTWKHDSIATETKSITFNPRSSIDRSDPVFYIRVRDMSANDLVRAEEFIRVELTSCLCEYLSLPARTRREIIGIVLSSRTEAEMEGFLHQYEPLVMSRNNTAEAEDVAADILAGQFPGQPALQQTNPPPPPAPKPSPTQQTQAASPNQPEVGKRPPEPPVGPSRAPPPPAATAATPATEARPRRTVRPRNPQELSEVVDEYFRAEQLRPAPASPPEERHHTVRDELFPADQVREGECCSICTVDFEANEAVKACTGCNQRFHKDCLEEWLRRATSCPLCRAVLDPQPASSQSGSGSSPQAGSDEEEWEDIPPAVPVPPMRTEPAVELPIHRPVGRLFDAPQRRYQREAGPMPHRFQTTGGGHTDGDSDYNSSCTVPRLNLVRCPTDPAGCCPVYTADGVALPVPHLNGVETWAAIRNLSGILRDAANRLDPGAFQHCFIFYNPNPSPVVAFNQGGWLGFDISYYIRDPRPFPWYSVFCHEYSHNDTMGHGQVFVHSLEVHAATIMESLARERGEGRAGPPAARAESPSPLPVPAPARPIPVKDPAPSPSQIPATKVPSTKAPPPPQHVDPTPQRHTEPPSPEEEPQTADFLSGLTPLLQQRIVPLLEMFPAVPLERLVAALTKHNGDVGACLDELCDS